VRVERVPGQGGKALDVLDRDLPVRRAERVAQHEIVEGNAEGMPPRIALPAAASPAAAERGDHVRGRLHGRALHVMQHAANAAELLSAARSARTAVYQRCERRAVSGRFLRTGRVHHQDAPMIGSEPEHQTARERVIGREDRGHEAAAAAARE